MTKSTCPKCGSSKTKRNGIRNGSQRFLCRDCRKSWSDSDLPKGGQTIGDSPMTGAERVRRHYYRQKKREAAAIDE